MPQIYRQIAKKIREHHLQTLTFDVFDTILLYQNWPEKQHSLAVVRKWQESLSDLLKIKLSPLELLEWRDYAEHELRYLHSLNSSDELALDYETWFTQIIDFIAERYSLDLSPDQRTLIHQTMLNDQLMVTASLLRPNLPLIQAIANLKQALPELKVYFIADEPFSHDQIEFLLDRHQVTIFDGGISSVDLKARKRNGELYRKIITARTFGPTFDFKTNLHVGDCRRDDLLPVNRLGGHTLAYRPIRARTIRTLAGSLDATIKMYPPFDLFDSRRSAELSRLGLVMKTAPTQVFLLASSQADQLKAEGLALLPQSFASQNLITAPALTPQTMVAALTWLLVSRADQRWNLRAIISLILAINAQPKLSLVEQRRLVYQFCFGSEYPVSELILTHRSETEFLEAFLQDFINADAHYTAHLREAYATTANLLPRDDAKVTIIDTDPSQSSAKLFAEFAKLHGLSNTIAGFTISDC